VIARSARFVVVEGIVQGVGFRPFVHRLATRYELAGWVRNTGSGVEAVIEGGDEQIDAFLYELVSVPPPLSRIDDLRVSERPATDAQAFHIVASDATGGTQAIPADVALCEDCRRELADPADRRYRYPFINCTNCGPRYSIVEALPFDRERTTMRGFAMCVACRSEYDDPHSRRYHAEPIACPACGPHVRIAERGGVPIEDHALSRARRLLAEGKVVAIKGIGGYHLACDARNDRAVERVRRWKNRGDKPLAIMVRDERELAHLADVTGAERDLLASPAHPVVLVARGDRGRVSPHVNPGVTTLGVMLPYTPLHVLLLDDSSSVAVPPALVLTSANRSSEPMIVDDATALSRLCEIADAVLVHDRPIATRVDDSVSHVVDGIEVPLRRARGYAPLPLRLPASTPPLLACGADMKNTFCLARGKHAVLSSYVGDLAIYDVYREYEAMIERLCSLWHIDPAVVCHDLHPQYWSRRFAETRYPDRPHLAIQHHHAHVAACMAENGVTGAVIGVAFDGTGYGEDGHLWGGEFFVGGYAAFERAAHLDYVPMFGGEAAIREPWRMGLAYLRAAGLAWHERWAPVRALATEHRAIVEVQAQRGVAAPLTSSVGRLFDGVAALIGLREHVTYDAQAAIELEALADPAAHPAYEIVVRDGAPRRVELASVIRGIVDDLDRGTPVTVIAARFHATLAELVLRVCTALRVERGLADVVLSGGVFQNRRLARDVERALHRAGFTVYRHHLVPANDGGLAYGQAAIGAARLEGAR
jgi:hydrogenase maturation protein HypF